MNKPIRSSYSQSNTYKDCSKFWHNKYKERWDVPHEGASLSFGNAVESAVNELLKGNTDYLEAFTVQMTTSTDRMGKQTPIFDNPRITYSNQDFDADVLNEADLLKLSEWAVELNINPLGLDPIELYKEVSKIKSNPYKHTKPGQVLYFNRGAWISLLRKGEVLIEAFKEQFLPRVENVISLQDRVELTDPDTGDSIQGYIDLILKLKDIDKPIIVDLKTAARPYEQSQLDMSEQLTLYVALAGERFKTDLVAYLVLCKQIKKDTIGICKSCDNVKDGSHKKCNNTILSVNEKGKEKSTRCDGEWDLKTKLVPEVQFMMAQKTKQQCNDVLLDQANIIEGMKQGIVFRNLSRCNNHFGSRCPYFSYCHEGSTEGLIKREYS